MDRAEYERLRANVSNIVSEAKKTGKLAILDGTTPCVDCGAPADRYDHRDYSKPLDVEPVYCSCNGRRGPAKNAPEDMGLQVGARSLLAEGLEDGANFNGICHVDINEDQIDQHLEYCQIFIIDEGLYSIDKKLSLSTRESRKIDRELEQRL